MPTHPRPSEPSHLLAAMATQPRRLVHRIAGCTIRTLSWGDPQDPPLVFVHGGAANSAWWRWIAPIFADRHHVMAPDLSGHGDSGRRLHYDFSLWSAEVLGVLASNRSGRRPVLVGHSLGGIVSSMAAQDAGPAGVEGLMTVDSPLIEPEQTRMGDPEATFAIVRSYASREHASSRFRLVPAQDEGPLPEAVKFVGDASVRRQRGTGRWIWKYDSRVFSDPPGHRPPHLGALIESLSCPVALVIGSESQVITAEERSRMLRLADDALPLGRVTTRTIAGGAHHLMFDRPQDLIHHIDSFLRRWVEPAVGLTTRPAGCIVDA